MTPSPALASPAAEPTLSRNTSTNAPKVDTKPSKTQDVHFTALIRLPFPRGDFVDPPQVEWDSNKDKALWKIISRTSKTSELDWQELASRFQVPHTFILQQAAWLYERHLSHVRAQMRKVQTPAAPSTSAASSPPTSGGVPMKRLGSGGGTSASRAPSSLSTRSKIDSPKPDTSATTSSRPAAPSLSRTPSTNTVTQSRVTSTSTAPVNIPPSSPRQPSQHSFRSSFGTSGNSRKLSPAISAPLTKPPSSPPSPSAASSSHSNSDSSSDSEAHHPIKRSAIFKRPPRFKTSQKPALGPLDSASENDPEEEMDSSDPSFLPFAASAANPRGQTNTGRTDIGAARAPPTANQQGKQPAPAQNIESSTSSLSSALSPPRNPSTHSKQRAPPSSNPLSPQHRASLAHLNPPSNQGSPSGKGKAGAGAGSDGTPSMGSSFSDLDDASVTQSALEDALLSKMQNGRLSTLGSLRSRYL